MNLLPCQNLLWFCFSLLVFVLCCTVRAAEDRGEAGTIDPDFFQLKPEVLAPPAVSWAHPLEGQKVRAVLIGTLANGLELAELQRRLDLEAQVVLVQPTVGLPEGMLGFPKLPDGHYNSVRGFTQDEMVAKLNEALEIDCELIVLANVDWKALTEPIQKKIERKVAAGTGLLMALQPAPAVESWRQRIGNPQPTGIDFPAIPLQQVRERVIAADPSASRDPGRMYQGRFEQGRVCILDWELPNGNDSVRIALLYHALTTSWPLCAITQEGWAFEYEMAAIIKAMLWTAGRQSAARFTGVQTISPAPQETLPQAVTTEADAETTLGLTCLFRDLTNQVVQRQTLSVALKPGPNTIPLSVPALAGGIYGVDLILQQGDKTVDFGGVVAEIPSPSRLAVSLDQPVRMPEQELKGTVSIENPPAGGQIRIEVADAYGRLLATQMRAIDGAQPIAFTLRPLPSLSTYNQVKATLLVNGRETVHARAETVVDRRDQTRGEYLAAIWADLPYDYLTSIRLKNYRNMGINTLYHAHYFTYPPDHLERGSWQSLRAGLDVAPYIWREYAYARQPLRDVVRDPCLSSPAYQQSVKEKLLIYGKLAARFAAPFASLGDESYLLHFWEGVDGRDVCFSPDCQRSFRVYLQKQYGSLARLNRQWKTRFSTWEQVGPVIYQDAVKAGNLSPWIDHRRHMTEVFQDTWQRECEILQQVDSRMPAGPEGMFPWDPFKGYDFERMGSMRFVGPYGTAHGDLTQLQLEQIIAFQDAGPDPRRIFLSGWYNTMPRTRQYSWSDAWWTLLHGYNGMLYFMGNAGSTMSGVTSDYRPVKYLDDTLAAVKEFRGGLLQLLQHARRQDDGVAILYSEASYLASAILSTPMYESLSAHQAAMWMQLLNDMGISHTHLSSFQVESGRLRKDIRVLVLPAAVALSDKEVEEIRRFVHQGGILIADVVPAMLDGHGGRRSGQGGALDDLFGVRQGELSLTKLNKKVSIPFGEISIQQAGPLKLQSGVAGATLDGHPVLIAHKSRRGMAFLLNSTLLEYASVRKKGEPDALGAHLKQMLSAAGVKERYPFSTEPGKPSELVALEDGSIRYLAVLRQPKYTPEGAAKFTVRLPQPYAVYDLRAQQFLGELDRLEGTSAGDDPRLFALLPYPVSAVHFRPTASSVARGQSLQTGAVVASSTPDQPLQRHVIRFEIQGPGGPLAHYTQMIEAPAGQARLEIPIAWNDPVGDWKITAREIVSGQSATITVTVK